MRGTILLVPVRRFGVSLVGMLVALTLVAPPAVARSDHIEDDQETKQKLDIHYADIDVERTGGRRVAVFEITTYKRWKIKDVSDPMLHRMLFGADFDSRGGGLADYSVLVRGWHGIICELHRYGEDRVLVSEEGTKGRRAATCSFEWQRLHATRAVRWRVWSSTWGQLDRAPELGYSTI